MSRLMRILRRSHACATLGVLLLAAACGGGASGTPTDPGTGGEGGRVTPPPPPRQSEPVAFTVPLVPLERIVYIGALGHVNPPSHTLPSDHIYFYTGENRRCPCPLPGKVPVSAPAAGVVEWVDRGGQGFGDDAIAIRVTPASYYYVNHVLLPPGLAAGQRVEAGASLGTTSGLVYAVDLGLVDLQTTLTGFIRPERYREQTVHAEPPLAHYRGALRDSLYARVDREGEEKDGKVDYDVPGRLIGGWWGENARPEDWAKQLYFLADSRSPTTALVSIGGTLDTGAAVYALDPLATPPAAVTPASGMVAYKLLPNIPPLSERSAVGVLLVRMTFDGEIQVQAFKGDTTARAFTAPVRYTR